MKATGKRRGRGEGGVYQRADGKWCASIELGIGPDGKRKRRVIYANTKEEAKREARRVTLERDSGLPVQSRKRTVKEFLTEWQADLAGVVKPRTAESYVYICTSYLIPHLGRHALETLNQRDVRQMMDAMRAAGLSATTTNYARNVLRAALNEAQRRDLIHRNVAALTRPVNGPAKEARSLSTKEAQRLLDAVRGTRWESLFTLAVTLGLRSGELLGLRWQDVDLDAATLTVRYQLQPVKRDDPGAGIVRLAPKWALADVKTARSRRTIPLPAPALDALKRRRVAQLEERLLAGGRWHDLDLVHASTIGTPVDPANLRKFYVQTLKDAGLPVIRFHDLRHSAAGIMAELRIPPATVQAILGHSDASTTLGIYTHATSDAMEDAADRLGSLFRASGDA